MRNTLKRWTARFLIASLMMLATYIVLVAALPQLGAVAVSFLVFLITDEVVDMIVRHRARGEADG